MKQLQRRKTKDEGGFDSMGTLECSRDPRDAAGDRGMSSVRYGGALIAKTLELLGLALFGLMILPVLLTVIVMQILFGEID